MTDAVREITYRDAVREAIREALLSDPRVFLMGQDIGRYSGCYAVTKGLLDESARNAFATRPSPNPPLSAPVSVPPSAGCAR